MRILIVEDDVTSRTVLCRYLETLGACDTATDGAQAVEAVVKALERAEPYELVCLDIMMPKLDGQAALREIRRHEEEHGIAPGNGAKVIMTTARSDTPSILQAFRSQCEVYLVKPVLRDQLFAHLRKLGLLSAAAPAGAAPHA